MVDGRTPPPLDGVPSWVGSASGHRIAILGGEGFIGSWTVGAALAAEASVVAVCVRDPWRLHGFASSGSVDVVMARQPWWRAGYADEFAAFVRDCDSVVLLAYEPPPGPRETAVDHEREVNRDGVVRLAEAASAAGARVIFASSADVYGSWQDEPVTEEARVDPATPYAAAKYEAELLIAERCHDAVVIRIATAFGPGENGPRAIPSFVQALGRGEPAVVHGDGRDVRDYVHVADLAAAIVRAAVTETTPRLLNVGSGRGRSTLEVLEAVASALGRPAVARFEPSKRPRTHLVLDTTRAERALGYLPRRDFEGALEEEARWLLDADSVVRSSRMAC